jgi:MFS family permease
VYLITAAEGFDGLVQYTTITVVQAVIYGVANVAFAKVADVFGRPTVLAGSIVFFAVGTVVLASARHISSLSAGMIFYSVGNTGIGFATNLVLADLVPAHWRCTVNNVTLLPFVLNFAVGPRVTAAMVPHQWRWGVGMFAILTPLTTVPVAVFMFRMERRRRASHHKFSRRMIAHGLQQIDLAGLLLLILGFGLLLLPLTIADQAPKGYGSGYIIAMFVLGAWCLVAFPFVERRVAHPAIDIRRLLRLKAPRDLIVATLVNIADAISVMLSYAPAYNWIIITFGWSVKNATYFLQAGSLAVVIFGIVGGYVATVTKRYKWLAVFGSALRLLALGLMYRYRGPDSTPFQVVFPQVLQGVGGAVMTANLQVAVQIAVPHADVAMVTGLFLMCVGVADAVGSAIAGAIQQNLLQSLRHHLSGVVGESVIATIYAQGPLALTDYPLGSAVRTATIAAWVDNTHAILGAAMAFAVAGVVVALFLQDHRLPETHNRVTGEKVGLPIPAIYTDAGPEETEGHELQHRQQEEDAGAEISPAPADI